MTQKQFVARIKKTSEYYGQTELGEWFAIEIEYRYDNFCIVGNQNVYRFRDVDIGVLSGEAVIKLK